MGNRSEALDELAAAFATAVVNRLIADLAAASPPASTPGQRPLEQLAQEERNDDAGGLTPSAAP